MTKLMIRTMAAVSLTVWCSIVGAQSASAVLPDINPEISSGYASRPLVTGHGGMVATANPLATQAGQHILQAGGNAMDAAIAAQLVLGLVEPQSSGIGGGGFMVYYDSHSRRVLAYDSRETAPAAAKPDRFLHDGKPLPFSEAVDSGLSVGTPGLLRGLELAHRQQGSLPWKALFQPAISLAQDGFAVSPRLHKQLMASRDALAAQPATAAYFLNTAQQPWPVGHRLKNADYAAVLTAVADQGADRFYEGDIARAVVDAVVQHPNPGDLTEADMAGYRAQVSDALCADYHQYRLCGAPPPSSGTLAVLQMLGILQHFPMRELGPYSVQAAHYFAEAGRLAFADRDFYVGDPDFVAIPIQAMLSPAYLAQRAGLIHPDQSMGKAEPGNFDHLLSQRAKGNALERPSTTHLVVADAQGNMLSMTSTIESAFGSKIFVKGFLLNNELTDFSMSYQDGAGRLVANRVEAGKRPRSSMAPMIVFRDGRPFMAVGSPGGSAIINYVAKTLLGVLDWNLDIQQAISLPNMGSRNQATELEKGTALANIAPYLEGRGHKVKIVEFPSGTQGIVLEEGILMGGADPRREGLVLASP